ncbi:Speckle-type POZ protein [Tetrabaena socialis]|uniref:Speckle-type POZ protein n=1 Tax=Tetrabaena socialis TaxID=47790 RepID=A0A2J8A672_9CHLO|nr:Speckle-type POZ protein [Tetrabaena socialis]|eukprot:PNH08000.1 Speckle-type POZ protein [Tetrabaena socialis]
MATSRVVDLRLKHPLRCVAVRPAPRSAGSGGGAQQQGQAQQVLLFTDGGCFELLGLDGAGGGAGGGAGSAAGNGAGVRVGPAVPLHDADNAEWPCDGVRYATYDASSSSLYATTEDGLVRIAADGRVTDPLSGYDRLPFNIKRLAAIAVDSLGVVYATTGKQLCMLLLPSTQAGQVAEAHGVGGGLIQLSSAGLGGGGLQYVAHDSCLGGLYVATDRAIYSVRGTTATLLAGGPDLAGRDGVGAGARFRLIQKVMPGPDGCLYVADGHLSLQLRKVTPDGSVSTLQQLDFTGGSFDMDLLPHGWLAVFNFMGSSLRLLQLGLPLPGPQGKPEDLAARRAWRDELAADLGALLLQPSTTSDVTVRVGGTDFPAHRAILSARCPYFERHFATSLGEASRKPIVELPEADPAAFRHILSYVYNADAGDWADLDAAQRVAELAERLLLPKLRDEVLRRLVAAVQVASVLPLLAWAERMGFSGAVQELLGFYEDHQGEVLEQEGETMEQLMVANPKLAILVVRAGAKLAGPAGKKARLI